MELSLFLGFAKTPIFETHLKKTNPHLATLLTNGNEYLMQLEHESGSFLGKYLEPLLSIDDLWQSEIHILSLLKKLVPNYCFISSSLVLLTVENSLSDTDSNI